MVGLSVLLEAQKGGNGNGNGNGNGINKKTPQVINKTTMMLTTTTTNNNKPSPPPPTAVSSQYYSLFQAHTFLDHCFLCKKRLLPGKDIYMYKGERAFCSVDCRCKHIYTDEEGNCSLAAAMMPSSSSSTARHNRKGATTL